MRSFESREWYTVLGRQVVTVALDQEEERDGLLAKIQAEGGVLVDGKLYQIDGIESFALPRLRKGMEIGLRLVTNTGGSA